MNGKKRLISLVLTVAILLTQFATMSVAADEVVNNVIDDTYTTSPSEDDILTSDDGLYEYYILEDGTAQIYSYLSYDHSEVNVPAQIKGYTVSSIYEYAFADHNEIFDITLPDTLVHIGQRAFHYTGLYYRQMNENNGLFYSGNYLLYARCYWDGEDSELKLLKIKEGTTLIADSAVDFEWVHIPESVKYIGKNDYPNHLAYAGSEDEWAEVKLLYDLFPDHFDAPSTVFAEKNHIASTCSRSGSYDICCTLCQLSVKQSVARPNHTKGTKVVTIAPTCANHGYGYTIYRCKNCSVMFCDDEVYAETPHIKGKKVGVVAPTCTSSGYTLYACSVCGSETITEDYTYTDRYNQELGHEMGQFIEEVAPSCLNDGEGYKKYDCPHCDDYYYDYTYADDYGHNYVLSEEEPPSCINGGEGYRRYTCTLCNSSYSDWYNGDYKHDYVFKERVPQTCTAAGYNLFECSLCKATYKNDYDYALGHIPGKLISQQTTSTCLIPAYKEYNCLICKQNYKELADNNEYSDYLKHNFVNGSCKTCKVAQSDVVESDHPYSHRLEKTWTITRKCDYMNISFSLYTRTEGGCDFIRIYDGKGNLVGEYSEDELAGETIRVNGNTAKITLETDGSVAFYGFSTTKIEAVCNHTYNTGTVTKAATCTVPGVKTFACTKCGAKKTSAISAAGHKQGAGVVTKAATTKTTGIRTYSCTVCKTLLKTETIAKIVPKSIKKASVSVKDQAYTGKALNPTVTVKLGSKTLKNGTDFIVSYKNNKSIGKATVTIKGKGAYKDSLTKTFKINPKKLSGLTVKAGKKQMTVSWKKASGVSGYEIVYANNSKFSKDKKTVTVNSAKTAKKVIKKLNSKKTYYVKVRAYKTVKKVKYYSAFTSAKKVKIK